MTYRTFFFKKKIIVIGSFSLSLSLSLCNNFLQVANDHKHATKNFDVNIWFFVFQASERRRIKREKMEVKEELRLGNKALLKVRSKSNCGDIQSHRWKSQLKMSNITKRSQMVQLRFKTQYWILVYREW